MVPLREIANRLHMSVSGARRFALRHGFQFLRLRSRETRGQTTLCLHPHDVDLLVALHNEDCTPAEPALAHTKRELFVSIYRSLNDLEMLEQTSKS
jgi:hypothetical protein